jgi:hypothetical protein
VRIQRRAQQARLHMFMEGARQVGVSFICVECICSEKGTLEEEGACLPGSRLRGAFLFLICRLWMLIFQ